MKIHPCFTQDGRTDGRRDMTKLTVVFLNFANAPNKYKVRKVHDKFTSPSAG